MQYIKLKNSLLNKISVIAEVGMAHDGNINLAHSYIDAVKKTGVSAIKFQTHYADEESTLFDKFRVKNKYICDKTRYDYWKRTEFKKYEWMELKRHAESVGLIFLSTPFSIKAFQVLNSIGIKAWKIGSGEVSNVPFIEILAKTKKPIILSTGLSTVDEISESIQVINKYHNNIALLQCTSLYPCPINRIGINVIDFLKKKFSLKVGFSDHSGNPLTSLIASNNGAEIIEVHVIMNREMNGFDKDSSLTIEDLKFLNNAIDYKNRLLSKKIDKNKIYKDLKKNKFLFEKSIFIIRDKLKGQKIKLSDISFRKPALGIKVRNYKKVIGKVTKIKIKKNSFLKEKDIFNY
jgi:N,N'-diacetyllegionaminate synthase